MDRLTGIHAVKEALEARRPIDRIAIAKGRQDTRVEEIVQLARKQGVPVRFEDRGQLDRLANSKDHQGVVALAAARATATLEDILAHANTGQGVHELTGKLCDFVVSFPTAGLVKSLNVSVAAGVVLFEAIRQRNSRTQAK